MANEYSVVLPIDAAAQRVWDLLADAPGYKRWNASVVSIDGPIELGGTIKLVSAVNPGRTFVLKVTAMDPPRRLVWTGGMPLGLSPDPGQQPTLAPPIAPNSFRWPSAKQGIPAQANPAAP